MIECFVMIGFVLFTLIIYGFSSNYACKVTKKTIFLQKPYKNFSNMTFIIVSDLHGQSFGKKNERLLKKIHENHPDAILIPGDLIVKNGKGKEVCFHLLKQLRKDYPVFYAPGNHEIRLEKEDEFRKEVNRMGVHYLENECISFQTEKGKVVIYGLSLTNNFYSKFWKQITLEKEMLIKCLKEPKKESVNVLLAHNPEFFEQYEKWGADVVISGHLHGGIISLGAVGVIAPSLRLFPKYSKGYYRKNNAHLYVSRGLGLHHIKLRFFNLPELAVITLVSDSVR